MNVGYVLALGSFMLAAACLQHSVWNMGIWTVIALIQAYLGSTLQDKHRREDKEWLE